MIKRRILAAVALLCALAIPAHAQSTKAQLNTLITTQFPNNTTGAITPTILRNVTSSIVNSIMPTAPVVSGNLACFNGTTGLLQDCGVSPSTNPLIVGTTPIASGTPKGLLYNNGGVLGNYVAGNPVFNIAAYASVSDAITAVKAALGGIVYFPCGTYNIGTAASAVSGIDLDDVGFPIRITGPSSSFAGPANKCLTIIYNGTGTAISARSTQNVEIDHLFILTGPATKGIDFSHSATGGDSIMPHVHDVALQFGTTSTSNIGIDLADIESAIIERNLLAANGGRGIRGVAPGRSFSVKATISANVCSASTAICISAPGQNWTVVNNTSQAPATTFIEAGPASTCTVLNVLYNWVGDFVSPVTLVNSNCASLVSEGNEYANAVGGTNILQTNSTGAVSSIGDRHDGTTAINIGTGNALVFQTPMKGSNTTTVAGTPDSTLTALRVYGAFGLFAPLTINQNVVTLPTPPAGNVLQLGQADGSSTVISTYSYGTSAAGAFENFKARGTGSAPTAVQTGDAIGAWLGSGYGATGFGGSSGAIQLSAAENYTDLAHGGYWGFYTTTIGTLTAVERMRIQAGVMIPATVTGGDKGANTLNIGGDYYKNGTIIGETATAPVTLSAAGAIGCATCVTSSGGGAITGTAPVAVSAAGAVSITGAAGQVLAGASPAFTATPVLGVAGATVGTLGFQNATSGTITLSAVTGALGAVTLSLPAATDTLVGKATTDELTNKTLTSSVGKGTWTASGTWTLPALTLGGTVSGGGNQINNVIIGTSTPLAANFTTVGATSQVIIGNQTTPTDTILTVNNNNGAPDVDSFGTNVAHFICADTTLCGIFIDNYGTSANQNFLVARMAGGTRASKTALTAGAGFSFFAQGWDGVSAYASMAGLDLLANNTQSATDHAGYAQFRTVPTGGTSLTIRLRVQADGGINIGDTQAVLAASELGIKKITASGSAPGAGTGKLAIVAGTNAGTCKLIMYAGTSTTPTTVIDNVGAGC